LPRLHPDDFGAVKAYIDLSMISGAANEVEARLRGGEGSYRWFLIRSNPLRDGQGQLVRWYIALPIRRCAFSKDYGRPRSQVSAPSLRPFGFAARIAGNLVFRGRFIIDNR